MDLVEKIIADLKTFSDWNAIYRFDESEEGLVEVVKKFLTSDYQFLDIVLTKKDCNAIVYELSKLNHISQKLTVQDLLYRTLLNKAGISTEADLFLDNDVIKKLNTKATELNKKGFRIHVVLDDIDDLILQQAINNLICIRRFNVMAYQSKKNYPYVTSNGFVLQPTHDFSSYVSDKYSKNSERGRKSIYDKY